VIGADGENSNAGNVYIFNEKTGVLLATLTSPNSQPDGIFGCCGIAIGGGLIAVGAPGENIGALSSAGRVYLYQQRSYRLRLTLTSLTNELRGAVKT
jgi:hypothetical protein